MILRSSNVGLPVTFSRLMYGKPTMNLSGLDTIIVGGRRLVLRLAMGVLLISNDAH
jgi:hypothetical protein